MRSFLLSLTATLMFHVHPAAAYVGPGAGLGAVSVSIALVFGFLLLLVGFFWYPLKRVLKGRKTGVAETDKTTGSE